MKILVIGSGGREHALAWRLAQAPGLQKVYVAPGNAGTARDQELENLPLTDIHALADYAQREKVHATVVGCVAASDAFFPFRDGLDVLAKAGATAVIQPGGSVRDAEVIAAADEHNLAMVFTGFRHFRH